MEQLLGAVREHGAVELYDLLDKIITKESRKFSAAAAFLRAHKPAPPVPVVESKEEFWKLSKAERRLWQTAKEKERKRLNEANGIDGRTLLTKENVERWHSEGKTFAAIARDIIGCTEYEVAAILKDDQKPKRPINVRSKQFLQTSSNGKH